MRSASATAKEWQLELVEPLLPPIDAVDPTLPPAARSAARKTEGLGARSPRTASTD